MSRILFAWELGGNYGHLSRQLPVAKRLKEQGHEVFFAVRDTATAAQLLAPHGFAFTQAPFDTAGKRMIRPPANYAEMLIASGYADPATLRGLVQSWLSLIRLFKADIVVVDHAPTALFASRLAGVPSVAIGNGFENPPNRSPLPSIRPWEAIAEERLARAEALVLERLNAVATSFGGSALNGISELFSKSGKMLSTFAELDHYGMREGETYAGPIYSNTTGQPVTWSCPDKPHIFVYLRPNMRGFKPLFKALSTLQAEVIVVAPGIRQGHIEAPVSKDFRVVGHAVQLDGLLASTDLAVSFGGTGTVSLCLLAGIPLLLMPQNVEQYLISRCVETLGAGLIVKQWQKEEFIKKPLESALHDPSYRQQAAVFANRYAGFRPEQAVGQAVCLIQTML